MSQTPNTETEVTEDQLIAQMAATAEALEDAEEAVIQAKADVLAIKNDIQSINAAAPVPVWNGTTLSFTRGTGGASLGDGVDLKGDKGDTGNTGQTGADGYSPTVSMSYFNGDNSKPSGFQVQITDSAGQHSANVYNAELTVSTDSSTGQVTLTAKDKNGTTTANISQGAAGADGADGADGVDGKTPTFEVGTVSTAQEGEDPSVTLTLKTGTDADYNIDFVLPSGGGSVHLLSSVTISGDSTVAIGQSKTYTFTASALLTSAQVDHFAVTFNGTTQNVPASNGSGTFTITIPNNASDGDTFNLVAVAYDNFGNNGEASTKTISAVAASVSAPTVTLGSNNVYPNEAVAVTGSAFQVNGIAGNHTKSDCCVFASNNPSSTPIWESRNITTTKTSETIPANSLTAGALYVGMRYYDATLGWSDWGMVALTVKQPVVAAPNITSPAANAEVVKANGMTVSVDAFSCTGGTDTQASLTVDICSDNAGNTVLATKTVTGTGTSVTFSESDLSSVSTGTTVYLKAQRTGTTYGVSAKSSSVAFKLIAGITTASGRLVYRHASNKGSVIEFDHFGTTRKVFYADAAYRGKAKFGAYGKDSNNPNIALKTSDNASGSNKYVSNSGAQLAAKDPIGIVTDATLQSWFTSTASKIGWDQDLDMETLCDTWMGYEGTTDSQSISGVPAVKMCRNALTDVFTGGCDLPDIYSLAVGFIEGETLDSLDPTAAANPTKAMGATTNTSGHGYMDGATYLWSASEYGSSYCLGLGYTGSVAINTKHTEYGVVPCKGV